MTAAGAETTGHAFAALRDAAAAARTEGRVADAIGCYATLRQDFPDRPEPFVDSAALLAEIGSPAEAKIVLAAGRIRFPTERTIIAAQAALGDETAAAALPDEAERRFAPGHLPASADLRSDPSRTAAPSPPAPGRPPAPTDWTGARRLLAGFVSLGAAEGGGELARLRRAYGVGDRGLLDGADLSPDHLTAMLDAGFAGVDAPETTDLRTLPPAVEGEAASWALADRRGWFIARTALAPATLDGPVALAAGRAWLRAGAAALATELRSGRRCFVYRMTALAPAPVLDRLRRALRGRRLVVLCAPDAAHPAGSVTRQPDGLLVGRVPTLHAFDEARGADRITCWLAVLAAAARDEVRQPAAVEEHADQLLETA